MASTEDGLQERLAAVPWATLHHAYGTAEDTSGHLLTLLSADEDAWQDAMYELWASICHQGSIYEASCAAVPFLLEIVEMVADERRPKVLYLLAGLANRDAYANRDRKMMFVELDMQDFTRAPRYVWWSYGKFIQEGSKYQEPRWMALAHERVSAGIPIFLKLLTDGSEKTQQVALYLLSAFKEHNKRIVPSMDAVLANSSSPFVRASALLGLSEMLEADSPLWDRITTMMEPDRPALLRFVSAVALARHHASAINPTAMHLLVDAMVNPRQLDEQYEVLPWNKDPVHVEAAATLGQLSIPIGLDGLCSALQQGAQSWRMADTVRVAEVILDVVFFGDWVNGRHWSYPTNPNLSLPRDADLSYYNYGMHSGDSPDAVITCIGYDHDEAARLKERFEREGKAALNTAQQQALLAVLACDQLWQTKHVLMEIYGLSATREALAQLVS